MQPDGILEGVLLAQETVQHQIPVSMSWYKEVMPRGSGADMALRAVDYVLIHTNRKTAEGVHDYIQALHRWAGYDRPTIINEDGVSTLNLQSAVQEHVGWGFYDQGLNNYRDGFQSPPVNWKINTPAKWLFLRTGGPPYRFAGSPTASRS